MTTSRLPFRPHVWELPVWAVLGTWAFLPGGSTPVYEVGTTPISLKHILLVALALYLAVLRSTLPEQPAVWPSWRFVVPLGFVAFVSYAFASLWWADLGTRDDAGMALTLVLALAALVAGYAAVSLHTRQTLPGLLWRMTIFLAAVGAVYTAESYFSLGLRGDDPLDFGIDRVRGPLFSAAAGHLALLPALGFAAQEMVRTRFRHVVPIVVTAALAITTLGLGSRAATFAVVLFAVLAARTVSGLRRRVTIAAGLAAVLVLAGVVLFARADPARLLSLQDDVRWSTHETAWEIAKDRGPGAIVFGGGLGSVWPWYVQDLEGRAALRQTSYGPTLFHPHSLLLFAGLELGIVGLAMAVALMAYVAARVAGRRARGAYAILGAALAASLTAFLFDHFLVRLYAISAIWWLYLFAFLRMSTAPPRRPVRAAEAPAAKPFATVGAGP